MAFRVQLEMLYLREGLESSVLVRITIYIYRLHHHHYITSDLTGINVFKQYNKFINVLLCSSFRFNPVTLRILSSWLLYQRLDVAVTENRSEEATGRVPPGALAYTPA